MMNIKYPEGSRWWKWDLHCHTPSDKNWHGKPSNKKEKKDFVKKYLKKAYNSGLKVLAITDHFDYRDIKDSYLPLIQEEAKNYDITILPGFEITAKEGSGIHLLVIFPEDIGLQTIQSLMVKLYPTPRQTPENEIPLSEFNIHDIYNILVKNISDRFILIFAHVDSTNGILNKETIRGENRVTLWQYKFIQFAQWTQNPFLYEESIFYGKVIRKINKHYAREITNIVASDCRSLEPIPGSDNITYLGQKYTWIKANPSFEGLKQILYDSEFRIKYSEDEPINENKQFFDKIFLGNNQLFEDGQVKFIKSEIPLNNDMITIIGSRGTGKSLFLDVFAVLHNKPSKYCENLEKINLNSDSKITFCKEKNILIESTMDNQKELDYIHVNQAEVKRICEDPIDMNEAIRQLIGIPPFTHPRELDDDVSLLSDTYFDLSNWFEEQDENGNSIHSEKYNNQKIEEYNNKIKFIKTTKSQEQIEKLRYNERKILQFKQALFELSSLESLLEKSVAEVNQKISFLNKFVNNTNLIPFIDFKIQNEKIKNLIPYFNNQIKILEIENKEIRFTFQRLGIEDIDFKMDQVKNFEGYINIHNNLLNEIKKKKELLNQIFPVLINIVGKFKENIDKYWESIESKWKDLKEKKLINEEQNEIRTKLLETIEIIPKNYFNLNEFYNTIGEYLNKTKFRRRANESQLERMIDTFNVKKFDDYLLLIKNEPIIQIEDKILSLKDFMDKKEFFNINSDREFLKCLYKSKYTQKYSEVISTTRFQNKEINSLSMGERGTLFLRLKLATAAFSLPFIFDQPEDDLDNDFIQNDLVPLFRKIKKYRQLIIATHDANIVVNSNAEQIIIAKNDKEQLSYISGGLEEKYIRERICEILEGGEEAFQKRARKYGLIK